MDPSALIVAAALSGALSVLIAAVAGALWTARRLRSIRIDPAAETVEWPSAPPRATWRPAPVQHAYRVIVVLDIERFSRPHWDDHIRVHARRALRQALLQAFYNSGIPLHGHWIISDTGDGLLVLVEPAVGTANVLRALLDRLADGLVVHNRLAVPVAQLRVRVVLHAGHVMLDDEMAVGEQVTHAFRLLDADSLRHRLSRSREPLVVAVSQHVYEQVVRQRPLGLDPDDFEPLHFQVKETSAEAWVHVRGGRIPANVSHLPFPSDRLPEWVS